MVQSVTYLHAIVVECALVGCCSGEVDEVQLAPLRGPAAAQQAAVLTDLHPFMSAF
jgi:hypothetical protein